VKVIVLISAVSVRFETVSKSKQTERGDNIFSEKKNDTEPKLSVFRFEPKEKKSVSQDTLVFSNVVIVITVDSVTLPR
jgi:hypothetical protein